MTSDTETLPAAPPTGSASRPKFQVVDDRFVAQTSEGVLRVPLVFKTKLLRQIRATAGDELDQFFALIDGIGDAGTSALLDELDIRETVEIVNGYFEAFAASQEATPGESTRSSI